MVGVVSREHHYQQELDRILRGTNWLMDALCIVRELDLPQWCIGAGVIRNAVWDHLHGYSMPTPIRDVDVAYFNRSNLSVQRDYEIQQQLVEASPKLPWEVTNQAGVHLWFEREFGQPLEPLLSVDDAVATWPETATSVAVRLRNDGELYVIAPFGLMDLFEMVVRRNPRKVSEATYSKRIESKKYVERWPRVTVVR